jgi:WD40 repeat protein
MQVLAGSLHHVASSISDSAKFGHFNSSRLVLIL